MDTGKPDGRRIDRRTLLKIGAVAGLGSAGLTLAGPRPAAADDVTLSIWTGYPELVPYYQAVADAYAKTKPGMKCTVFGTSLREHEQKLSAAVPTGTGPDIYDVGFNISINFIEAGLITPNPADVEQYLHSGAWSPLLVDVFTRGGKSYGLPLLLSTAALYYNKAMFKEAGIANPPATFGEMMEDARKLTKIDASGKMTRSGMSLRLSGQGSGIAEKFRFVLEPAGGSLIVQTPSGKYHQGYDNDAGRAALKYYVDAVQKYKVDDPKVQHDADAFIAGNTAMLMREAWVIGGIQEKNPSLDYGVVPVPSWTAGGPNKMLLQPWGIYVNGKSSNQTAAWDFLKFLTNTENMLRLTTMSGWVAARQDVDWKPLLQKIPQFEVFVSPPKNVSFYVEPVLPPWDEIETRLADQLPAAYVDPSLLDNPAKIAELVHKWATQTDGLLKEAGLYGTS
jgi:multiple sugar transport system substrate-binding protein